MRFKYILWSFHRTVFNLNYDFCRSCNTLKPRNFYSTCNNSSEAAVDLSFSTFEPENQLHSTPIIILHGLLGSKQNWRGLGKAIAKTSGRQVYALDARNHGDSPHSSEFSYRLMAADVKHFMKNHAIPTAVLIGHSMGGRTAMTLALTEGSLLSKLVVVDVSPLSLPSVSSDTPGYMLAMKEAIKDPVSALGIVQARKVIDNYLSKDIREIEIRQFLLTNLTEKNKSLLWKPNIDVLLEKFYSEVTEFPSVSQHFLQETLFICGEKSPYVKPEDHSGIRRYFPNSEFVIIPGAGHWVHSDRPSEFLETLCNFL